MTPLRNLISVFRLVLLISFFGALSTFSQEPKSYENRMLGHWISQYPMNHDPLVYIPFNSPLAERVSDERKYCGITFKKDGIYLQHNWHWCGNDDSPDFYSLGWNVRKIENNQVLVMMDMKGQLKKYIIIELTEEKIILTPFTK